MPYRAKQKRSTLLPQSKGKMIGKNNKKIKKEPTYDTPEKEYVDQNTLSDTPNSNEQNQASNSSIRLVLIFIKQLHSICHYAQDTLYVCLQLLNRLKIQIEEDRAKLYAAVILQIAAKVHQFRTPRFSDLVVWGNYVFSRQELIAVEGIILLHLNFQIPTSLNFKTVKQAIEAIKRVQLKINCNNISTFQ